jgi:protoporphyrinogen oxidase
MPNSLNVAVIGAGAGGLTAAYELARAGHTVTVYEAGPNAGGLASGFKADGWEWTMERFYHHLFASDSEIINLAQEIGIGDKVFFRRPITSLWHKGKVYALDSALAALRFPHLDWINKFRFGLVTLYLRLTPTWQPLEKFTAEEWLTRWMGRTAYQVLWEPLFIGKFGDDYKIVNMAWFWARIHKRSPNLGYFVGGFQTFADALAYKVEQQGGKILYRTPIQSLAPRDGGGITITIGSTQEQSAFQNPKLVLERSEGSEIDYDAVIATVSPWLLAKLTPALSDSYLATLHNLKSLGAVVLIVALDRQLTDGFYWISLSKNEGFPFLALVEHTNFIDSTHYGGDHLLYLGDYLPPTHPYFQMSQAELEDLFLPQLKRFNPAFDRSWVRRTWLFREPYAQPVMPIHYSKMIPPVETPLPGLYFASMSQVYPWDRGTNYAVEIGREVARLVMKKHNGGWDEQQ